VALRDGMVYMGQSALSVRTAMVPPRERRLRNLAGRTRALQLLGVFLLLSAILRAGEWQVGTVPGSIGGKFSSLKLDKFGNAHVAYCDSAQSRLRYSFWDHLLGKWFTATVGRCGGFTSLVLDSKERPHISYPSGDSSGVVHVYWDGSSWITQPAEVHAAVINYYASLALDVNDNPSIIFYEEVGAADVGIGRRLRKVTWNGQFWEVQSVDSEPGSGKFNAMVPDSKGNPRIAYANVLYESASLRYAWWNGSEWIVEILEGKGVPGTSIYSVGMVLGADDTPHIAYTDVKNKTVKYATKRNGKWELEVVDLVAGVAYPDRNGIAVDEEGNVYISYYDSVRGVLKVAHRKDRKWVVEVVDQHFCGFTSSIQISQGEIWVTYASQDGQQLKVARRPVKLAEIPGKTVGVR
jgi:hypothetical protein